MESALSMYMSLRYIQQTKVQYRMEGKRLQKKKRKEGNRKAKREKKKRKKDRI
jgi:hypothetical protein